MFVHDALYAAVDDKSRADCAWLVRAVKRCSVNGYAEFCRLDYCVLLRVYGVAFFRASAALYAEFVSHTIAFVAAVEYACGGAVVTRGQYALVLDDYRSYRSAFSCATRLGGNELCHIHKSFVPIVHILLPKVLLFI